MIILPILAATSPIHFFIVKVGRMYFLNLGVKGVEQCGRLQVLSAVSIKTLRSYSEDLNASVAPCHIVKRSPDKRFHSGTLGPEGVKL